MDGDGDRRTSICLRKLLLPDVDVALEPLDAFDRFEMQLWWNVFVLQSSHSEWLSENALLILYGVFDIERFRWRIGFVDVTASSSLSDMLPSCCS